MATIKSYTDLEQSKKLAEILPIESADMWWAWYSSPLSNGHYDDFPMFCKPVCNPDESVPCWSCASLLGVLPDELTDSDGDVYRIDFFRLKGKYIIQYPKLSTLWPSLFSTEADNPIDACVAMIEKLHELKML